MRTIPSLSYRTNREETNGCLVRLFEQLAFKRTQTAMFYQLAFFNLFDKILQDPVAKKDRSFSDLRAFCKRLFARFVVTAGKNSMAFAQILFWKNSIDAADMEDPFDRLQRERERAQALLEQRQNEMV